jgi:hypothetical protein
MLREQVVGDWRQELVDKVSRNGVLLRRRAHQVPATAPQ